MGTYILGTR